MYVDLFTKICYILKVIENFLNILFKIFYFNKTGTHGNIYSAYHSAVNDLTA